MRHLHITLGSTARTARTGLRRWFTMTDAPAIAQGPVGPDHPEHSDHSLFAQIREAVSVLDAELGKPFDEASERMAARELPLATQHGVDQVAHVVLSRQLGEVGEHVFLVRGELSDPAHLRAHITTQEAMETSVDASLAQLDEINRRLMLRLPPRCVGVRNRACGCAA